MRQYPVDKPSYNLCRFSVGYTGPCGPFWPSLYRCCTCAGDAGARVGPHGPVWPALNLHWYQGACRLGRDVCGRLRISIKHCKLGPCRCLICPPYILMGMHSRQYSLFAPSCIYMWNHVRPWHEWAVYLPDYGYGTVASILIFLSVHYLKVKKCLLLCNYGIRPCIHEDWPHV